MTGTEAYAKSNSTPPSFPSSAWERRSRSSASNPYIDAKRSFVTWVPKRSLGTRANGVAKESEEEEQHYQQENRAENDQAISEVSKKRRRLVARFVGDGFDHEIRPVADIREGPHEHCPAANGLQNEYV